MMRRTTELYRGKGQNKGLVVIRVDQYLLTAVADGASLSNCFVQKGTSVSFG